ncbi:MAG: hypothetical protein AVDCRST_MAG50-2731 [uncultured Acidimicrobiales bacterium]|uniref:N-acetyltransferase domain-containing protein n=1 Tax=uncultured Acidimicrobiales bacterium TaxID=310071 RepID=A0A6J4ISP8_9ACTN|nr:MAG: hypothetical protein AVDCRST_MAG50-2731 [uncultured Acidimicrobiales bacterium]
MEVELRPITADEFPEYSRVLHTVFGDVATDDSIEHWRGLTELDRTIAVIEDGKIVATNGAFSFDLALPGATTVPCAGVTAVGVLPTHRRRGLLRRMMAHQLDDVAGRGEPVAVLTASESVIYPRFGYGQAAGFVSWSLATTGVTVAHPPSPGGRIRLLDRTEAGQVLPTIYDRCWRARPGQLSRNAAFWYKTLRDPEAERDGASAFFFAVHESAHGEPDGYAMFRRKGLWEAGLPAQQVLVDAELIGVDEQVEATLWTFLLELDLVRTLKAYSRPADESFRWRLADPRRMQITYAANDHLWVRIVDVAGALAARRYRTEDRLVLELADPFRPANEGRWAVEGGPDGAVVHRTQDPADFSLGAPELGAIYLGGVAPTVLARAGRVIEHRPGAVARADLFFGWAVAPWCANDF